MKDNKTIVFLSVVAILLGVLAIGALVINRNQQQNIGSEAAESYGSIPITGQIGIPAASAPDVNIKLRGKQQISGTLGLTDSPNGPSLIDPRAPKICTIFSPYRLPQITNNYAIGKYNGIQTGLEPKQPALVGLKTVPGEKIQTPGTGVLSNGQLSNRYNVGGGNDAIVVYADNDSLAFHVGSNDGTIDGYAVHLLGVKPDPALLSLYNSLNAGGRHSMPAVRANQTVGTAIGSEIQVSVRDTGDFLDPRWKQEWWPGCPTVPTTPNGSNNTPTPQPQDQACFDNCFQNIRPGNGSYCRDYCKDGTPSKTPTPQPGTSGTIVLEDDNSKIVYSKTWDTVRTQGNYTPRGGSFKQCRRIINADCTAEIPKETTLYFDRITVGFPTRPNGSTAEVLVDGQSVGTINQTTSNVVGNPSSYKPWVKDVPCQAHTIKFAPNWQGGSGNLAWAMDYVELRRCTPDGTNPPPGQTTGACQGNVNPSAKCFSCLKDTPDDQLNILDFSCFRNRFGKPTE